MNTLHGWDVYPPNPQQSGWHWLRHGILTPAYWDAEEGRWSQGGICCGSQITPEQLVRSSFIGDVDYVDVCIEPSKAMKVAGAGAVHPMTRVELLRRAAHQIENDWLRDAGWSVTMIAPSKGSLWKKTLDDGTVVVANRDTALDIQQRTYGDE